MSVSRNLLLWTANRVITQHAEVASPYRATGTCKQCRDSGCDMLAWAIRVVQADLVRSRSGPDRPLNSAPERFRAAPSDRPTNATPDRFRVALPDRPTNSTPDRFAGWVPAREAAQQ